MIGSKIAAAALLLSTTATGHSNPSEQFQNLMSRCADQGWLVDGKLEFPVARLCTAQYGLPVNIGLCSLVTETANVAHVFESKMFCSHGDCNATYNAATGLCQCSWGTTNEMNEGLTWPGKHCDEQVKCYAPLKAHWNPTIASCTCAANTLPPPGKIARQFAPSLLKERLYGPFKNDKQRQTNEYRTLKLYASLQQLLKSSERLHASAKRLSESWSRTHESILRAQTPRRARPSPVVRAHEQDLHKLVVGLRELKKMSAKLEGLKANQRAVSFAVRSATTDVVSLAPLPTYIPPPNTEVTQELIQESLQIQPQKTATVGSVIPHFADGVVTFLVQLDGPISQTLSLNATDTLPCENIGAEPQPDLILVPKTVKQGTPEVVLPTCLIIAVNMYDPKYITYWVQREDGSVFSLLSDNEIHAIDQLDTSQTASITIRVAGVDKSTVKRATNNYGQATTVKRHQIYSVDCNEPCPFYHMESVRSSDGHCGCMFKDANQDIAIVARGVEQPSPYTTTMTAAACAAMTCINNGGKPALFNPFTATCWCTTATYVEENNNAYNGRL